MLRQVAILIVRPALQFERSWLDQLFDAELPILKEVGLMSASLDFPCRRAAPTLMQIWAESTADVSEAKLVDNAIARLDALSRTGPLTIVTNGGGVRDWPALKLAALRRGSDLGMLATLQVEPGHFAGEQRIELIDLALWLGPLGISLAPPAANSLLDREELVVAEVVQLYRAFLRFLAVTGRMSAPVYRRSEDTVNSEVRRLRGQMTRRLGRRV